MKKAVHQLTGMMPIRGDFGYIFVHGTFTGTSDTTDRNHLLMIYTHTQSHPRPLVQFTSKVKKFRTWAIGNTSSPQKRSLNIKISIVQWLGWVQYMALLMVPETYQDGSLSRSSPLLDVPQPHPPKSNSHKFLR